MNCLYRSHHLARPLWKRLVLTVYYHATRPVRWRRHLRAAAAGRVPVVILFYHRVAEAADNPWTVSQRMFARQVTWLRKNFELVDLAESQRRIRHGVNHRPCACITFDDGYADNCTYALPWLLRERIPFAYFVTLHNVLSGEPFAHDLLWGKPHAPNTLEQICALADAGVEIGSHGFSHADLGAIDNRQVLDCELAGSRDTLQRLIRRTVRYFAFPFGQPSNITPLALRLAWEAGYEAVCSAYGGLNLPGDDGFHLLRIGVDDDLIGLVNAATGDPRHLSKQRQMPRIVLAETPLRPDDGQAKCYPPATCPAAVESQH